MNGVHPALAFLREKFPTTRVVGPDTLRLEIDGARVEVFVAPEGNGSALFATGATTLAYRCGSGLSPSAKERLRRVLLEIRAALTAGRIGDPHRPLPTGGGWTDRIDGASDLSAWRDWVVRGYRAAIEEGRTDDCQGLPDCLDLRMRPAIPSPDRALHPPPRSGPCARCGRSRACSSAREHAEDASEWKPLRHVDGASAELAALHALATEAAIPMADALEAYTLLGSACGDRSLAGALPLEFSVRLPEGARAPDRLRFVSYYPLVASDPVRREMNRGRRAAARTLAARWLTPNERAALDAWLACIVEAAPDTLGLSIGMELDRRGARLQLYAHPGPDDGADRLARAVVTRLGGAGKSLPPRDSPVLVGIALAAGGPPALKLYYRRAWDARHDTGLRPEGLGELEAFNPGWGLAIHEHVDGRAAWVKWDFPVAAHYQDCDRFLAAFRRTAGDRQATTPDWLSGEHFSPWPTWASLGRGGAVLYFLAR
ncbi:MAG: hypothetical protein IT294_09755 [Deltaproteobacteria bacterium]|nr:hypothetical protein [Deltaproteobacteria bacterium]